MRQPVTAGRASAVKSDGEDAGPSAHPERRAAQAGEADQHVGRAAAGADPVVGPRRPAAGLLRKGQRRAAGRPAALPHLVAVSARRAAPRALAALLQRRQERGRRLIRLPARKREPSSVRSACRTSWAQAQAAARQAPPTHRNDSRTGEATM